MQEIPLPLPGEEGIPLECWEGIVHHRDRRQLQKEIEEIAQGRKDRHAMNYRLTDRDGHRVWINAKSEVQTDDGGKAVFLAGSISELAVGQKTDSLTGFGTTISFWKIWQNASDRAAAT